MRNREAQIQAAIVAMIRQELPGAVAFAVLNDGLFSKSEAAKRLWMGLLTGCPDVAIIAHGRPCFLEVKAPGARPSPEQVATMARLEASGARCAVVRSVDEAREVLTGWGLLAGLVAA